MAPLDLSAATVAELLRDRATEMPDSPFFRCDRDWMSYLELDQRSERLAASLAALGVERGARVAILATNRDAHADLLFAAAKGAMIQVPLNPYLKEDGLMHQLRVTTPRVVIADEDGCALLERLWPGLSGFIAHVVALGPRASSDERFSSHDYGELLAADGSSGRRARSGDPLAIYFTSGTSGPPKGCLLSHGYFIEGSRSFRESGHFVEGDRHMTSNTLFHAAGPVASVMPALIMHGSVYVPARFSASTFMREAREQHVSVVWGTGAAGMAILAQPARADDASHPTRLACFFPFHPDAQRAFRARFGIEMGCQGYGQTELMSIALSPPGLATHAGELGKASPFVELTLLGEDEQPVADGEIGEIVVRPRIPHLLFDGYWGQPDATRQAIREGWYHTGDMARMSESGTLTFFDRRTSVIRRRGENISSLELEQIITSHPDVARAAVFAVPSAMTEDDIKVCVVPEPGREVSPRALVDFLVSRVPYYAIPRFLEIWEDFPLTETGKVRKTELAAGHVETIDLEQLSLLPQSPSRRN